MQLADPASGALRIIDPSARDILIIKRYADLVGQALASSAAALMPDGSGAA